MSHIVCSDLAYAHPGGDLLFENVSFRISPGDHVALVGANGVGKSTLLRVLIGELPPEEGEVSVGGRVAFMPQDVGSAGDTRTVRELLLGLAAGALGSAGRRVLEAERALESGDDDAGMALGSAIGDWSELGGYELEGQWDAACRRIVRSSFSELADRPAVTLSGGERKRLVLDVLFASDADVLLLDEPDNFLDVPAKRALEAQIAASRKTVLVISHDREVLAGAAKSVMTLEGNGCWIHPGSYATYRPRARPARRASATRSGAGRTRSSGCASSCGRSRSAPATARSGPRRLTPWSRAGSASPPPVRRRRPSATSRSRSACAAPTRRGWPSSWRTSASTGSSTRSRRRSTSASGSG
jgi:ATPase subunit of ABC transporter with duplicated ATPase domains